MKEFLQRGLRVVAGFALSACTVAAFGPDTANAASLTRDPVAAEQARASAQAAITSSRAAVATRAQRANDLVANPDRAYPASCLSDGLPYGTFRQFNSDPAPLQLPLTLPGDCSTGDANECNYRETVTVTVWRVPCSPDSAGNPQSATLLEIDRPCGTCSNTSLYPTFPIVQATQGNNSNVTIRIANDQNTLYSTTFVNTPIYYSDIWVLENYLGSSVQFDYNQPFALALDNTIQFNLVAYNPNQYHGTTLGLPISGYMTSNWYSPGHGGEGMLTQIFDDGDGLHRTFTTAWYTFDKAGLPFWLYAQGSINIGDRSTGPVDTYYPTGGTFAGAPGPGATFVKWGTITFSFPDCDDMSFTFSGNADAVNGPTGTGQRTWIRIANVNSIVCD